MTYPDLVAKLQRHLANPPLTEESQAVYLLVECRKLLEHQNEEAKYPFLKFYADWAVHTEKDRLTPAMRRIIAEMETAARYEVQEQHADVSVQEPIREFAVMRDLRGELEMFLRAYGLPDETAVDDTAWRFFVELLVGVLEDQPINANERGVKTVTFVRTRPGCLTTRIEFTAPVSGAKYYDYEEAY